MLSLCMHCSINSLCPRGYSSSIPIQSTTVNYNTNGIKSVNGPLPNYITMFVMGQICSKCANKGQQEAFGLHHPESSKTWTSSWGEKHLFWRKPVQRGVMSWMFSGPLSEKINQFHLSLIELLKSLDSLSWFLNQSSLSMTLHHQSLNIPSKTMHQKDTQVECVWWYTAIIPATQETEVGGS
jgi:hypothetical protein